MAWLVERTNAPFKAFAYLTAIISLGTPFVLYVIAWLFLLGRNGPVNECCWRSIGVAFNVFSMTGMILVEGFLWSPLAFLLLSSVFQSANADFEEAARDVRRRHAAHGHAAFRCGSRCRRSWRWRC